jgi:hypothetical protein
MELFCQGVTTNLTARFDVLYHQEEEEKEEEGGEGRRRRRRRRKKAIIRKAETLD